MNRNGGTTEGQDRSRSRDDVDGEVRPVSFKHKKVNS